MANAVLRSAPSSPHVGQVEFGATRRARQGWAGTARVEYDGEIWAIDLDMIDVFLSDTVGFFDEIAASDWMGPSRWQSEFAELTIEARGVENDLVALDFKFWWSRGDELDNEREGQLVVRRDVLPDFAHRLRELTGAKGKGRLAHTSEVCLVPRRARLPTAWPSSRSVRRIPTHGRLAPCGNWPLA